jgi:hypothetical protein
MADAPVAHTCPESARLVPEPNSLRGPPGPAGRQRRVRGGGAGAPGGLGRVASVGGGRPAADDAGGRGVLQVEDGADILEFTGRTQLALSPAGGMVAFTVRDPRRSLGDRAPRSLDCPLLERRIPPADNPAPAVAGSLCAAIE